MSVRKKWMLFLMVLCLAVTIASVASLAIPAAAKEPSGPVYVLRDNGGRLALYDAESGSLLRQDVYKRQALVSLPPRPRVVRSSARLMP